MIRRGIRIGASHRIAIHDGNGQGRLIGFGASVRRQGSSGRLIERYAFGLKRMERRHDARHRLFDSQS